MATKPRTQAVTFALLVLAMSWPFEAYLIATDGLKRFGVFGLIALMWIPGAISLLYRHFGRLGFGDVGWRFAGFRFYIWAIGLPLILALLTNAISVPLGMKAFGLVPLSALKATFGAILFYLLIGIVGALGEEIGWRGFLLPKMIEAKIWNPYISSGIVWALWHIPIVAFGGYYTIDAPLFIAVTYGFSIIISGYVIGILRMRSDSVWVATAFHSSHNFFFQLAIPRLVFSGTGPNAKWWELVGGDCGIIVGVLYLVSLGLILRGKRASLGVQER